MEKWKIAVGVFVCAGLLSYGTWSQRQNNSNIFVSPQNATKNSKISELKILQLVGQSAPTWQIEKSYWMNTPQPLNSDDLRGRTVLVEFFRIDCEYCQSAVPFMKRLHKQYSKRGLQIIGIQSPGDNADENDWGKVQEIVTNIWQLPYPVAFDEKARLFTTQFRGEKYPSTVLIDQNGVIQFAVTGHTPEKEKATQRTIEKLLGAR